MSNFDVPAAALEADLRRRLAVPGNPLTIVAKGLAWRSVLYCVTSIVVGLVGLVAGVVGFVVLPLVARQVTRLERVRIRILGLPRLPEPDQPAGGIRGIWRRTDGSTGSNIAVWGSTVLFGLLNLIPLTVLGALVGSFGSVMIRNTVEWQPLAVVLSIVIFWITIILGLYILWALASAQAYTVRSVLTTQSDLTHRVAELTLSRSELVDVFEGERRRIERDLHDGAQQHLVVSTMRLGEAVYLLDNDRTDEARECVLNAQQDLETALSELRDTIRGLHPQVLTDRGLVEAVRELAARQPVPVTFALQGEERPLPPAIENAAYHVASEALTNVVKYAKAGKAMVTLSYSDPAYSDDVTLTISDDGIGGARSVPGHGLSGLAERMAAAGGALELHSPEGGPTVVIAHFGSSGHPRI